ncbi:MAG: hypothetical protein ACXVSE_03460 [Solirubrobacteraceae bacterium]
MACTEMAGEAVGCETMNSTRSRRRIAPGEKRRCGSGPSSARGPGREVIGLVAAEGSSSAGRGY